MTKSKQISVRLEEGLADRLDRASDKAKNPYAPTKNQIVERGIELALRELEKRAKR